MRKFSPVCMENNTLASQTVQSPNQMKRPMSRIRVLINSSLLAPHLHHWRMLHTMIHRVIFKLRHQSFYRWQCEQMDRYFQTNNCFCASKIDEVHWGSKSLFRHVRVIFNCKRLGFVWQFWCRVAIWNPLMKLHPLFPQICWLCPIKGTTSGPQAIT